MLSAPSLKPSFEPELHSDLVKDRVKSFMNENCSEIEGGILMKMIKYKNKYVQAKQLLINKNLVENQKITHLTESSIQTIKNRIGDKYFRILYSTEGFFTTFLPQYWQAEKLLLNVIKTQFRPDTLLPDQQIRYSQKQAHTMYTLLFLRQMLCLRLDAM